jgi:hypothetical protein
MNDGREYYIVRKYQEFYNKYGYYPKYFAPYNCSEIIDYAPTLTRNANTDSGRCGTILIMKDGR